MSVTIEEMREFQRRLREAGAERSREHSARLRERLPAMVRLLKDNYGARRVWVFGSLAAGTATESSDVDLAVEHLDRPRYFHALGDLFALAQAPVDLVCLEEANPSLADRIRAEGVEL